MKDEEGRHEGTEAPRHEGTWTAPQRGVVIVLLTGMLVYLAVRLFVNPVYVSDPQPPIPTRAPELEDRIDPNITDAATLAALPQIGGKRARDIIAYREHFVAEHPGQRAFAKLDDLLRIKGIGAATLSQIEPYLIFAAKSQAATLSIAPGSAGG
jgi:hypothetical protein